ncbi:MAG: OmpA family protein [Acidithiobacillus sp.]|nr:OmpA family protein [Acidithiobacillus sp.]
MSKQDDLEELEQKQRHAKEGAAGSERWLISYADFMTLLLAFFIVMYAISSINKAKVEGFEKSMVTAFGGKPPVIRTAPPKANEPFHHLPSPVPLVAVPPAVARAIQKQQEDMEKMQQALEKSLHSLIKAHEITVDRTPTGTRIRIAANVLFPNGKATLQPEALKIVDKVGVALKGLPYQIYVEGYTNNQPIRTAKYPSNWYLSAARSIAVVNRFLQDGINPNLLSAVGRGKYHPAVPYTKQTMQKALKDNRRVTIVVRGNTEFIMKQLLYARTIRAS